MPPKYYKTGHKEHVAGRMRVIYQKANSQKQYIKKGDNYVAIRKSKLTKGGTGPMKVNKDNILAVIIVDANKPDNKYYYAFNETNMEKLNDPDNLFKTYISFGDDEVKFENYPIDAIAYKHNGSNYEVEIVNTDGKIQKYTDKTQAVVYCLDVKPAQPATPDKRYVVITFIVGDNIAINQDYLKSGDSNSNGTDSKTNASTENPKTLKQALEHIDNNYTNSYNKLSEYGKQFYSNISVINSP
jgi:hypothetical protein